MRWLIFLGLVCVARAGQLITGCNDPGQVANAKREGNNFDDGATVTFTCNSGFRLKGKGVVTCQDVGGFNYDWVPGLPSCERVKCGAPEPAKANSKLTFNSDGNIGDKAWYKCDDGFLPKRRDIVCELNGDEANWSDGAPTCRRIKCGDPEPAKANSKLTFNSDGNIGDKAWYKCDDGFLPKRRDIVCQRDGDNANWSDGAPTCRRIKCGDPEPAKANSKLTFNSDGNIGDKAWYKCDDGFLPKRRDIVCQRDGDNANWSDGAPTCRRIQCEDPRPARSNGRLDFNGDRDIGDKATYRCNEGFLPKRREIVCERDGDEANWSAGPPKCKRIQCGDPEPAGENGRLDFDGDRNIGDKATYRCNPGFEPKRREIVCELHGDKALWSAGPPTCEDKTCPKFDERKNTEVAVKEPGDKAAYIDITLMTAQDEGSGLRDVVCTPPPARILAALGPCDITCTATDNAGNACEGSYTITVVDRAPKCKKGFKASGGRCFKIIEDELYFEVACKRCQKEGGFLANARDRDESEEVGEFLKSENAKGDYWFNLQSFCSDSSRTWQTVELNTVKFDGWRSNPGSGECAMMGRPTKNSKRGKIWGKACCYHRLPAVCEA